MILGLIKWWVMVCCLMKLTNWGADDVGVGTEVWLIGVLMFEAAGETAVVSTVGGLICDFLSLFKALLTCVRDCLIHEPAEETYRSRVLVTRGAYTATLMCLGVAWRSLVGT
ncbi:unnamed protein product [Mesocestoides corti]|uniref:Uncharacterized protein n=1 Tax=Mesocestoides corti TaxID=53468 RepID=A0A0R3UCL3_MESCO|nr:unnamed protein product [Mesocestoides corti]